ncbi:polyadenylate-binding protein-interacting protein 1-like [Corapipo altera]|uniref:polyadenylate-binding protein-interacting protein 1-like n=1 Tax=Corapipo altera TaxID=415028 RepID=UPI000FD6248D|nr:polyadenylate-binding protein-interacting protein 1-like [Corapipo altera]
MTESQVAMAPVITSKLSLKAPEFYPSGYNQNFAQSLADSSFEDGYDGYLTLAEYVQDFLNHLAEQPGCFETEIEQFTEIVYGWVTADETLQELVELVYQQTTTVPNFSYMGTRLCNYLSHHLTISPLSGNFRQLLLQRCQTEYENRDEAAKGDETARKQFHAFVLFLAKLYLNLEIKGTNGQVKRAEILQEGLRELLNVLFSNPVDNNLMCAVKLLKEMFESAMSTFNNTLTCRRMRDARNMPHLLHPVAETLGGRDPLGALGLSADIWRPFNRESYFAEFCRDVRRTKELREAVVKAALSPAL